MTNNMRLLAVLLLGVAMPFPGFAMSIGVSPGKVMGTVYLGDTLEQQTIVSRSDSTDELLLGVSTSGFDGIDIGSQSELVIPEGELSVPFKFQIDSTGLGVGTHEGAIQFVVQQNKNTPASESQAIVYGVAQKIVLAVATRPDPTVVMDAREYRPALEGLRVSKLSATVIRVPDDGRFVRLDWTVENSGLNPVSSVPVQINLSQRGDSLFQKNLVLDGTVPPGGAETFSHDYPLDGSLSGGTYNAVVRVGDKSAGTAFWVLGQKMRTGIVTALAGTLSAIVVALTAMAIRRLTRRHH